jgi:glycosyltransferase involved in cell wall biosynthesis/ActR/RegA family two-component response regulator
MKILAIDDQQLILLPLEKRLTDLGYEVKTEIDAVNSVQLFESFKPDLVLIDINMSEKISGLDIIKYIRLICKSTVPIIVLSGNNYTEVISDAFDLGISNYLKKPLSLNEICIHIKRLIGTLSNVNESSLNDVVIQKRCVGIVIPCYNEESRLLKNDFLKFIDQNTGYHLCFVNDGSTDNTLGVLNKLKEERENNISVYDCKVNGGKAEAVRLGMLYLNQFEELDYLGFLDADLSTDLLDFDALVTTIENSNYKIVSGSRIPRMGANISKDTFRGIISSTINFIICKILEMDFRDTQCGAKIFAKDIIKIAFKDKFVTKWLFDVEIFVRMKNHFKLEKAKQLLCEKPLKRWVHVDGSKLSFKDSLKIIFQLGKIAWVYNNQNTKKTRISNKKIKLAKV